MKKTLRVRTVEELVDVLLGEPEEPRLVLLESLARSPEGAQSLGGDVLAQVSRALLQLLREERSVERTILRTAAAWPDPELAAGLLEWAPDPLLIEPVLSRQDAGWRARHLLPYLEQGWAAQLLADVPLHASAAVAVAVRSTRAAPAWAEAPEAWLRELAGPYAGRARQLLDPRPVAEHWQELTADTQAWVLETVAGRPEWLGCARSPEVLARLLEQVPVGPEWLGDPDPRVREMACRRYEGELPSWRYEPEPQVQAALVERLSEVDEVLAALRSPHWEVRAAASMAAARVGAALTPALRKLALAAEPGPRAAAVQALVWLEDEDWLRTHVLGE